MKKRILFVDDDRSVLAGLRNRLHKHHSKWDMMFLESGRAALDAMARQPFDMVISDMRMPEMDGATLLKRVRDLYPGVVRIVLSGHAELDTALRAVPVAHQFLSKPSEPGVIENIIERAFNLQALINDAVVLKVAGSVETLPSLPHVYSALMAALGRESVAANDIAHILKQDTALCAKILQMVNSAFFRVQRTISRIEEAVAYLGFNTIKCIALSVELFQCPGKRVHPEFSLEALQRHAFMVSRLASGILTEKREQDDAFIAGILHDVGKLVLITELPQHVNNVLEEMRNHACPMHVAEQQLYGTTHAEIGGYLLALWGLPYPIIETVANHHAPARVNARQFGVLAAVHVANALVCEAVSASDDEHPQTPSPLLDMEFLDTLGVTSKLAEWREKAERMATAESE